MKQEIFKLFFILNLIFFGNLNCCWCQNYIYYGDKVFGGNRAETYVQIINSNNNLLLIGSSLSDVNSGNITDSSCAITLTPNPSEIWVVKFDTSFNIIGDKKLGGEKFELNVSSIVKNDENSFMFSTMSNSIISCEKSENNIGYPQTDYDYWIVKMDSNGIVLMDKTFGTFASDNYPYLTKLSDGNFLVVGSADFGISGDKTVINYGLNDYWVLKFDSLGNKIWDNHFGGTGQERTGSGNNNGFNILPSENSSFILSGTTNSPQGNDISEPGLGSFDEWVIKVDSSGNKLWDKRFGGNQYELGSQIIKAGNGFMVLASTNSPQGGDISDPQIGDNDVWILRLDSSGNKIWDRRYGGTQEDLGVNISNDVDNGFIISAQTESPAGNSITDSSFGGIDYWIFKIDSVGNKIWDKRFGGPGNDFVSNFVIMPDSSIFLCGFADSGYSAVKSEFGYGMADYWVVHFKFGNSTSGIYESNLSKYNGKVYPNPANNSISFEMNNAFIGQSITLKDITGRFISSTIFQNKITLDIHDLKAALYLYEIKSISGERFFGKFLKYD